MPVRLANVEVPGLEVPVQRPRIPASTYERRCKEAYRAAGLDWLVVYADREHSANTMFLAGFDPRFEEALLLLGPNGKKFLVCGNESYHYAPRAGLQDFELVLCQTLSLMGQDRSVAPSLDAVLRDAGIAKGSKVGIVGWKYLEADAWELNEDWHRELLSWAARVHEVGLDIAHYHYHKHGAYLIEHSDLAGFSRQDQQMLSLLVRGHRRNIAMGSPSV